MLEARGLVKFYGSVPAVTAVSFTLQPGQVLGYLGPNGSGKSTTVKMLTGLLQPTDGQVLHRGHDIHQDLLAYRKRLGSLLRAPVPPPSVLAVPFLLSYCLIAGTRLAFELPADLRANWIFRLWLAPHQPAARAVARSVLLAFSLGWLAPPVFLFTFYFSGWLIALLHTALWAACNLSLVEILLLRFRKIPCTCAYPPFQSHSGLLALAYLFGFVFFTGPLPDLERWILRSPIQLLWSVPLFAAAFVALRKYRSQMLDMDKSLIFEQESPGFF